VPSVRPCASCGKRCYGKRCKACSRLSREDVLAAIRAQARPDGEAPNGRAFRGAKQRIAELFGSWPDAVEAAGFARPRHGLNRGASRDPDETSILGSTERDRYGCVCTLREASTGRVDVVHYPGTAGEGIQAMIADADSREGDWRLLSYSTPNTVYADLHVRRPGKHGAPVAPAEVGVLSRARRLDLLDASIRRPTRSRAKSRPEAAPAEASP
jgi:HNH endonuclease